MLQEEDIKKILEEIDQLRNHVQALLQMLYVERLRGNGKTPLAKEG